MRTSFRHQSEAQPPNGPLTAATSPDTPSTCPAMQSVSVGYVSRDSIWGLSETKHNLPFWMASLVG
jgi:hypothetical protein